MAQARSTRSGPLAIERSTSSAIPVSTQRRVWQGRSAAHAAVLVVFALFLMACELRTERHGTRRVELWTIDLRARFSGYMQARIKEFEADHPGVVVEWVDVPFVALERKLIAAAAAGRAPDVVNVSDVNFARFAALGAFRDLEGDLPGEPRSRYIPGALEICELSGKIKALPWYLTPQARLANTALLAKGAVGIEELAVDWRGLAAQAIAFRERTGAYLFSQALGEESQLPIMLLGEGLVPFKEDEQGRLRASLATSEIEDYLGLFVDLYRRGVLPRDAATRGHAHLTDLYQEGRLAVINTGPNFVGRIQQTAPEIYGATEVLPGMVGGLGRVHLPIMVLAVTTQSQHPREAAALVWHLTGPEAQLSLAKMVTVMPSTRESLNDPFFSASIVPEAGPEDRNVRKARAVSAATLPTATGFTARLECWPDLRREFEDHFKLVLLDGRDLHASLIEIELGWNRILSASDSPRMESIPRPERVEPVRNLRNR